ncbi:guanine nucleotide exchange factor DBS isoform X5 [Hermetia illucens]|uniref:guanine nucleotide exchange factor DBS isoform X5 n=1 Tax=Hermetia illucens TaxID=343691 RepID=UPI0018CC7388|nr:guanine nucleotide exchange factor DBS isoform X5 [Hermetia illucens]
MENSPNSMELQIDTFLEQFKRSASKAMDGDWGAPSSAASSVGSNASSLAKSKSRSSCLNVADLSDSDADSSGTSDIRQSLHKQHHRSNQHIYQHQNSVSSTTSVQTVLNQSLMQNGNSATPSALPPLSTSFYPGVLQSNPTGGSSNSLLQQAATNSSNVSSAEEALNIADVADLLHPQHAIITGGKSPAGCPLIIFPDNNNFHLLEDADYQKLILYLTSVPSMQDADLGFHVIIDRRKDRWTAVKAVLLKISVYFPGIIHVVYVLRPSGFFQKAISEVSSKFFKEEFRFRLIVCASLDDLHEHIEKSQLTGDMGGTLIYSHHEWIQQRISLEKFSSLTHQVSTDLDAFIQVIHDTEFPNSVEATQKLIDEQGAYYEKLKEEILSAAKHGEGLLDNIKSNDELKEFSERTGNVSSMERLLVQLEETERRFDEFWIAHQARLKQCLELRRFEQDFRELQTNFDSHLKTVSEMTEIGETVVRVDTLIKETKAFQKICQGDIERAEEVISAGQHLIGIRGAYPKEVVQPKCDELSRVCDIINERLARRLEILSKSRELMERVEKANKWCAKGIELLASQRIEKCSVSGEIAEQSLQEIQQFISSASEFKLSSPREFKNVFQESTTPETKALVTQVLQRIDDVSLMCDKRIASLKKLTLKPPRPVQTVTPEPAVPLQPPGGAPHLLRRRTHSKNDTTIWMDVHDTRPRSMDGVLDSGISLNGDTGSSPDSDISAQHLQNQPDTEARRLKRGHVLTELLETERIYVTEMASILRGYRDQMVSEEMASLVPPSLQGKEDILFGNLHELYKFHSEVFLKDLENCISTTELVALCFVQRRDTFYRLYSFYCQNIPRSERLRETLVDAHLFLQECQKRLGHKLPLAAYLLKPVQRITKYQLLLKDLLRFSDSGTCTKELQKALDCMLIVLKCVNDSMHQIAITGFPSDLSQQGELLLQDSFQVWTESKKDIRLRLKTQQRHIFLYQKVMLLCKQGSKTGHNKSTYQYKHHVNMSQIGLTESVRGDPKRFEVWLQGRQEVHTIQAPSIEIKNKWVTEIKKVLLNQLEELKGENIKQYGLNHKPLRHTTSWDTPCAAIMTTQRAMSCDTSDINRHSNGSDDGAPSTPGMGSLSSERDSQDAGGWSSDYSNSEDELSIIEDSSTPGSRFIALADYCAVGHSEVSMKEGETVELLKIGCAGWWFVRVLDTNVEGWTPAAYLGPANRKSSRSCSRNQDKIN